MGGEIVAVTGSQSPALLSSARRSVLDRATAPQSSALRNPDTRWGSRGDLRPLMGAEVVTPEEPHPLQTDTWHACYSLDRCGTSSICPRPSLSGWYCQRWSANALIHAVEKLEAFGPQLGYPHTSAVQGFTGLRELRPRAGRSPWRALYRRVSDVFVLAAVGPEAQSDQRGFDRAARQAVARLAEIEED